MEKPYIEVLRNKEHNLHPPLIQLMKGNGRTKIHFFPYIVIAQATSAKMLSLGRPYFFVRMVQALLKSDCVKSPS